MTSRDGVNSPRGHSLFECILVFDNYPIDEELRNRQQAGFRIEIVQLEERINYPLTVAVSLTEELHVNFIHHAQRFHPGQL